MREFFFALSLPFIAQAAPEASISLGSLGSLGAVKAEIASPHSVILKSSANKVLLQIKPPSPAAEYETSKTQIKSYQGSDGVSFVVVRFFLKKGGEDLSIAATKSGGLSEIIRESLPDDVGRRFAFLDLNGDGSTEILRYYTEELAILCDGERAYLGAEVYDNKSSAFSPIDLPPAAAMGATLLPASFIPPVEPSTTISPFHAASSREGFVGVSSVSAVLSDHDAGTAWVEGKKGAGLGEFVTAPLRGSRAIVALSVQTPSTAGVSAPKTVLVALGNGAKGSRIALSIPPETKPGSTLWYKFNTPIKASCASLIIAEASANTDKLGIAGVRLVSLQELSPKEALKSYLEDLHSSDLEKSSGAIEGLVALPSDKDVDSAVLKLAGDPLEKAATRSACISVLQRRGAASPEVIAVYIAAVRSQDESLQKTAKSALSQKTPAALSALRDAFQEEPSAILAGIIGELLTQGADAALFAPALLSALGAGDATQNLAVRRALLALDPSYSLQIMKKLKDPSPMLRVEVARSLGDFISSKEPPPEAISSLVESLQAESLFEPSYAMIGALSHSKTQQGLISSALLELAKKSSEEALRARAAKALGGFTEVSVFVVESLLQDPSPMVRRELLVALATRKEASSANVVAEILQKDPWGFVRSEAANTAAVLRQEVSDAALSKALYDPSKDVSLAVIGALRANDRKSFAADLRKMVADEKVGKSRRVEAAYALGDLGGVEDAKVLLKQLQDYRLPASQSEAAEEMAVACALSLAVMRYKPAYEELELMVTEGPGPVLQKTGVCALGLLGDVRAVPLLQLAAKQKEDPVLAKVAKEALERLGAM